MVTNRNASCLGGTTCGRGVGVLTTIFASGLLPRMAKAPKTASSVRVPFTNTDGRAAFLHFLPLAQARIAAGKVSRPARAVSLLRTNVERGVAALLARQEAVLAKVPSADFAPLQELPALAAALDFATSRVPTELSDGEIAALLAEVRPVRKLTLGQLDIFAELGLVPAERVATIRAGTGPIDTARDAVAIVGLFEEFAASIGTKHPFTEEHFATLTRAGNALLRLLVPEAAKDGPATIGSEAAVRDALYGEVLERYETARELGVAVFGIKGLDTHLPKAHTRVAAKKVSDPALRRDETSKKKPPE